MMQEKLMTSSHPVIASYLPLVDFLGKLIGPHCEVVLHDLTTPERSVVGIANGYISGRNVGAPLTDFALRLIKEKAHSSRDFLHEYEGALKNGRKVRSSTFFIKDNGALVGLLCFNVDMSRLQGLHKELDAVLSTYFNIGGGAAPAGTDAVQYSNGSGNGNGNGYGYVYAQALDTAAAPMPVEEHETFSESIEELMSTSIAKAVEPFNLPPDRLSPTEREEVVLSLYKRGFFQLRGAVEHVAEAFRLSEATIYRYLKSVQKKG
ncbi:MAG: hypothetical protein DELT_02409 [Desulfovibrio sp.]